VIDYRIKLFFNDHIFGAGVAFSGGSWALPLSNLQDPRPTKKARSSSANLTDTRLRVDLGASRSFEGLHLTHTNLSDAALYRIIWYSDAFATEVDNTGWQPIPGYPTDDPDGIGVSIFHLFDVPKAARYWQWEIDDTGNADGFVEIGRLCMMDCWTPPYNFAPGASEKPEPNTPRLNSLGGVGYFNRRRPARTLSFSWARLPGSEFAAVRRLRKISNTDGQVVVIPDPTDTASFNETCLLATLRDMPAISLLDVGDGAIGFDAIEVL
jgi:hypothetical protein